MTIDYDKNDPREWDEDEPEEVSSLPETIQAK